MKFKKGDIVICTNKRKDSVLELHKRYVVDRVMATESQIGNHVGIVFLEDWKHVGFDFDCFIKLERHRLNKIRKIKYNMKEGNKKI